MAPMARSRPSADGTGTATSRTRRRGPPSAAATASRSAAASTSPPTPSWAAIATVVPGVAQDEDGGVGPHQPPGLRHDRAVGVLLVQGAGHPPRHLRQGRELPHLAVELARAILHTGEKLTSSQL